MTTRRMTTIRQIILKVGALFQRDTFQSLKARCEKCGADCHNPKRAVEAPIRYANDAQHGERMIFSCWRCGYRWSEKTLDNRGGGK